MKKLNYTILSLIIYYSNFCAADDGEIFFNDKITHAKPNVVFLLDTSNSMQMPLQNSSRLGVLKSSLTSLLNNKNIASNIRTGIMTFGTLKDDATKPNIQVLEPVDDVDLNRDRMIKKTQLIPNNGGNTPTVYALYAAATYLTPNTTVITDSSRGPIHDPTFGASPIIEGCQLSHIILMSDGQPTPTIQTYKNIVEKYISTSSCATPKVSGEYCGRELAKWVSSTDQDPYNKGNNFIRIHTIGFALGKNDSYARTFLRDIANIGQGKAYEADTNETLSKAFAQIISDVRQADGPAASGTVTISEQVRYSQRPEVFYSLYSSDAYDYWPGNMKRFKIAYVETDLLNNRKGNRAVLVDSKNASAMSPNGTFYEKASSFWSTEDGGLINKGGVLGQLKAPASRTMFTLKGTGAKQEVNLQAGANLDLKVSSTAMRDGLLNFIRGYIYQLGGSTVATNKKLGDAARGRVTLATYGCSAGAKTDLLNCTTLNQIALLASNDGFIRGYDINNGSAVFEYMPKEMLSLIQKLYQRDIVSFKSPRHYGLDGKPVIYHNDLNNDGYINNNEEAYVYIAAGRGGPYLYALDISSRGNPTLKWQIDNTTPGFSNLGYTWSTPMVGKVKLNGTLKTVLIFGGGYDKSPQEEDTPDARIYTKGSNLYIVDAENGNLLWSASSSSYPEMKYSIPSTVATVNDAAGLVTDIIVGDMGGQVWRFNIDNTDSSNNLTVTGSVIAELADYSTSAGKRKFYQAPGVYETKFNGLSMLSVTIGSGYRNHPLNIDIKDRIYSLRIPKTFSIYQPIIKETDLAKTSADGQSIMGNLSNGFMIELSGEGEKVITDGFAGFDRFVFNTFIPSITGLRTCVPAVGTQRTYNFDLNKGISLLNTAYESINIATLPPDVSTYCDGRYCTIVSDPSLLSKEKSLPKGKEKDAFIVDVDAKTAGTYIKISWTDLFDISIQ